MLPELAGIGADPAMRASFASVGKRLMPAISPTSLAAIEDAAAALGEQPGRGLRDERREL